MNLFHFNNKINFNKSDAKKEISSLAKRVNQMSKANQLMQNEYDFWIVYSDLIKEVLKRYMSTTKKVNIDIIIKDINEANAKLKGSKENLKQEISSNKQKV